jgi:uncharacterized protein DUF6662
MKSLESARGEPPHWTRAVTLAAVLLTAISAVRADERLFTYVQEAEVLPKGGLEFEHWLTHRRGKADGVFSAWDFREELEYGLTDKLSVAGYLNFKSTHSEGVTGIADESSFEFEGISAELKYQLLNPNTKPVGVLLYGEATYNGHEFELEQKLVLQRTFGDKWVVAFNATLEEEWKFTPTETEEELKLELTAGASYKINSRWSVGIEGRNHREFAPGIGFDNQEHSAWFVGPNVHYGRNKWWATLTVLPQVHGSPDTKHGLQLEEHERIEVRMIVGVDF